MRNWNETLYFGDMPGRSKPLDSWTADLGENSIDQIVCLIPEDEVAQESPEYADWIDGLESDRSGRYLWLGTKRVSFTSAPVHDYGVPEDADAHEFWEAAFSAALAAFPGIPSGIFRISTDRTNSSWATFSRVAPSPLSSPVIPA